MFALCCADYIKTFQRDKSKPRSGRRNKTTPREDRILERLSLNDRKKTSKMLSSELVNQHGISISARTVRRRLGQFNLQGCKAQHKPLLTERHRKLRLTWARKYKNWTCEDWAKVIWSEESNIEVRKYCI